MAMHHMLRLQRHALIYLMLSYPLYGTLAALNKGLILYV